MKPERYTIMVVPDTAGTSRNFSLKRKTLLWLLALGFLVLVVVGVGLYYYVPRALNYNNLQAKNERLMAERFQVMRILEDYNRIRNMDSYIREVLGAKISPEKIDGGDSGTMTLDSLQRTRVTRAIPELPHSAIDLLENVPSLPPVDGYVTQDFYNEAVFHDDNHFGLDIIARQGEVIKAAASGLVVFSNWTYQYGNTIILYHGDGYITVYSHNQRNIVLEREWVERGEPIAFLGNTGKSRGPHLHFEIWKNGQPENPKNYIFIYEDNDVSVERQKLD